MVFSDTSLKNGIVQFTESLCKLGDGGITNDTTLFAQMTGYLNQAYKKVASALLKVDRNWRWDDFNYSDFPIATITLVTQQRDYTLPAATVSGNASTLYRINRVRVLDLNNNWIDLSPLPFGVDETPDTLAGSGIPTQYRLIGNSIRLSPKPLVNAITLTNALEIQFQRSLSIFTVADTTKQPGFNDSHHDLLAYDAAASYLMPYEPNLAMQYAQIFQQRLQDLQVDWTLRNDDIRPRIIPRRNNYDSINSYN